MQFDPGLKLNALAMPKCQRISVFFVYLSALNLAYIQVRRVILLNTISCICFNIERHLVANNAVKEYQFNQLTCFTICAVASVGP